MGLVPINQKAQDGKLSLLSSINVDLITHNYLICLWDSRFISTFLFASMSET